MQLRVAPLSKPLISRACRGPFASPLTETGSKRCEKFVKTENEIKRNEQLDREKPNRASNG